MKAYVTSCGERTVDICIGQLKKFGFEVVHLSKEQPWAEKYKQFIACTNEDCIRVDADVIVNEHIKMFCDWAERSGNYMCQASIFDLYRNKAWPGQPVFYKASVFPIIRKQLDKLSTLRPETWAWRLPEVNAHTETYEDIVVGLHGFFSGPEAIERAKKLKEARGQINEYDFELVTKLQSIL
jgi:hypothetical protein